MSLRAFLVNWFLRLRVKARPGTRLHVQALRAKVATMTQRQPATPADITCTSLAAQPAQLLCPAAWFKTHRVERTVMYLHGGGYIFGNIDTHKPVCAYLSRVAHAQVLSVDYRLAPEHPCPAALQDALHWYRELLRQGPASSLILAGDSAGGGLVLACLQAAQQAGLPMPAAAVLFSPWVDLSCSGETMHTMAHVDVMFSPDSITQAADIYLAGQSATNPIASPLYGNFKGLPPLLIFASQHELLLSDALRLHDKAQACGNASSLVLEARLPHVWPTMVMLPEARASLKQAAAFMSTCAPSSNLS